MEFHAGYTTEVTLPTVILEREAYEEWLKSFWPLMGADEKDDDDDSDTDDDKDEDDDTSASEEDDDDKSEDDKDDDSDEDDDKSELGKLKKAHEKTVSELKAAQKAIQKAKAEARDARSKAAQESGDWEKLAKERETEIQDLQEKLAAAEEGRTTADTNLDNFQRQVRVTSIASRLGYRDPKDAIALLSNDDTGDDKTAERALRKLAGEKEYLVDQRRATGRQMGGGNGGGNLLTKEQMQAMSPQELIAQKDLVDKSLAAMASGGGT